MIISGVVFVIKSVKYWAETHQGYVTTSPGWKYSIHILLPLNDTNKKIFSRSFPGHKTWTRMVDFELMRTMSSSTSGDRKAETTHDWWSVHQSPDQNAMHTFTTRVSIKAWIPWTGLFIWCYFWLIMGTKKIVQKTGKNVPFNKFD